MPINGKVSGADFKTVPPGSHVAVCNIVADMGVQEGYFGSKRQIYLRFEVPAERVQYERDGKKYDGPVVIGTTYTLSMHEKATLRKQLENWRGKKFTDSEAEKFDIASILGKACMLSVVENERNGKVYANIQSIGGLPKGVSAPSPENALVCYDGSDESVLKMLPEWLQKKISEQIPEPEKEEPRHAEDVYITDDDIPF